MLLGDLNVYLRMPVSTRDEDICKMVDAADLAELSHHFTRRGKRADAGLMDVAPTSPREVDKLNARLFVGARGGSEQIPAVPVPQPVRT